MPNTWDSTKWGLRGKLIKVNPTSKSERSYINNWLLKFTGLGKQEQIKPNINKRKDIIKTRAEMNEMDIKNKKYEWNSKK